MSQIEFMDNLLKEYLTFRGFSHSLKTLDSELKSEKDQSFRSEKVMELLNVAVQSQDLQTLRCLWLHLENNLFSKLDRAYSVAVKKLENSLMKWYLVIAYSSNRGDKVNEFFSKLSTELQQQSEWKDWFYFPFCKNAEESPIFSLYFTKQWQDTLQISLRNFLTTIYQCLPQPIFIRTEQEAVYIRRLQEESTFLKNRLQNLFFKHQPQQICNSNSSLNISGQTDDHAQRRCNLRIQLNDIIPFDVNPPNHIVDDFCIIASEVNNVSQATDGQAKGLKMLIRNIGGSPIMGRKDHEDKSNKRRSGSVGRNWT